MLAKEETTQSATKPRNTPAGVAGIKTAEIKRPAVLHSERFFLSARVIPLRDGAHCLPYLNRVNFEVGTQSFDK